jgi:hypothetical protein
MSMTSRLRPSPSVPILTSRKIQATLYPQVKDRSENARLARRPQDLRQYLPRHNNRHSVASRSLLQRDIAASLGPTGRFYAEPPGPAPREAA